MEIRNIYSSAINIFLTMKLHGTGIEKVVVDDGGMMAQTKGCGQAPAKALAQ